MSESVQPNSTSPDLRRGSHSDRALPGLALVAALVTVVSIALLFIGYRVFQIESQRRAVNDALQLLEGKDAMIAQVRERRLELSQVQLQVDAETSRLDRLRSEAGSLLTQAELQQTRLEASEKQLVSLQEQRGAESERVRELVAESGRLRGQIEQHQMSVKEAESAAERSRATRGKLLAEVDRLGSSQRDLAIEVGSLEANRDTLREANRVLKEDQRQIRQIRDDLGKVFDGLLVGNENVKHSARSLEATAANLESTTQPDLAEVSKRLSASAESIDKELSAFRSAVQAIANAEQPIARSRAQIERASSDLKEIVDLVSGSLRVIERKLDQSTQMISATASRLPAADESLSTALSALLASFEDVRKESAESSRALADLSAGISQAASAYENELGNVETRLRASADRLERTVREVEARSTPEAVGSEPAPGGLTGEPLQ